MSYYHRLPAGLLLAALGAQASEAEPAVQESELIETVGRRLSGAYHAGEAEGAKAGLALRELPQSVRVLTRQFIDDLGASRLDETLDYVGGVSRQNSFGGLWDNPAIRGLPGNENTGSAMLLNGFAANRGFNAPRDMAAVEKVEFLKGPAAALYGASEPGGTLNIISKAPQWRTGHALDLSAGSADSYRAALDSTGPLADSLAYRFNAAQEDKGSFRDHISSQRTVLAPALSWRPGAASRLEYRAEWLRHAAPLDRGVVAINGQLGAVARERFLGEPADGDITVINHSQQLRLSQDWGEAWQSRLGLSWRQGSLAGFSTEATAVQADGRTLTRQRRYRDYGSDDLAVEAELAWRGELAGFEQESLFGYSAYHFVLDQRMLRINPSSTNPYSIDLFAPVYGQAQPTPLANTDTHEQQTNQALYAQQLVHLDAHWKLLAGLRLDDYRQSLDNHLSGLRSSQRPHALSPRLGLSWLPGPSWTVYANAGQSFRPNAGSDAAGQAFAPERGRALEAGLKWEAPQRKLGATLAWFDIRKRQVLTGDPLNSGYSLAAGELGSRGLEFDLAGQLSANWRLNASLVHNAVKVRRDQTLAEGGSLINVPRFNASILAVYEAGSASAGAYGLGGGLTHVGERLGESYSAAQRAAGTPAFMLPAYTTAKLLAYWRLRPTLRVSLDIDNLFDRTYYSSSVSRVWVVPGSARSVNLGLQTRF